MTVNEVNSDSSLIIHASHQSHHALDGNNCNNNINTTVPIRMNRSAIIDDNSHFQIVSSNRRRMDSVSSHSTFNAPLVFDFDTDFELTTDEALALVAADTAEATGSVDIDKTMNQYRDLENVNCDRELDRNSIPRYGTQMEDADSSLRVSAIHQQNRDVRNDYNTDAAMNAKDSVGKSDLSGIDKLVGHPSNGSAMKEGDSIPSFFGENSKEGTTTSAIAEPQQGRIELYQTVILHLKKMALQSEEKCQEKEYTIESLKNVIEQQNESIFELQRRQRQQQQIEASNTVSAATASTIAMQSSVGSGSSDRLKKIRTRRKQREDVLRESFHRIKMDYGSDSDGEHDGYASAEEDILVSQQEDIAKRSMAQSGEEKKNEGQKENQNDKNAPSANSFGDVDSRITKLALEIEKKNDDMSRLEIDLQLERSQRVQAERKLEELLAQQQPAEFQVLQKSDSCKSLTLQSMQADAIPSIDLSDSQHLTPVWVKRKVNSLTKQIKIRDAALNAATEALGTKDEQIAALKKDIEEMKNNDSGDVTSSAKSSIVDFVPGDHNSQVLQSTVVALEREVDRLEKDLNKKESIVEIAQRTLTSTELKMEEMRRQFHDAFENHRAMERKVCNCMERCDVEDINEIYDKIIGLQRLCSEKENFVEKSNKEMEEVKAETLIILRDSKLFATQAENETEASQKHNDAIMSEIRELLENSMRKHEEMEFQLQEIMRVCDVETIDEIPAKIKEIERISCSVDSQQTNDDQWIDKVTSIKNLCEVAELDELPIKLLQMNTQNVELRNAITAMEIEVKELRDERRNRMMSIDERLANIDRCLEEDLNEGRSLDGIVCEKKDDQLEIQQSATATNVQNILQRKLSEAQRKIVLLEYRCEVDDVNDIPRKMEHLEEQLQTIRSQLVESQSQLTMRKLEYDVDIQNTSEKLRQAEKDLQEALDRVARDDLSRSKIVDEKRALSEGDKGTNMNDAIGIPKGEFALSVPETIYEGFDCREDQRAVDMSKRETQAREEIRMLESDVAEKQSKIVMLEDRLKLFQSNLHRIAELETQVESLQKAISKANDEQLEFEGKIQIIRSICELNNIQDIPGALAELQDQIADSRFRLTSLKEIREFLTVGEELKLYANDSLLQQVNDLQKELSKTKRELRRAKRNSSGMDDTSRSICSHSESSMPQTESVKVELSRAETKSRLLQDEVNNLRNRLAKAETEFDDLQNNYCARSRSDESVGGRSFDVESIEILEPSLVDKAYDGETDVLKLQRLIAKKEREIDSLSAEIQEQASQLTSARSSIEDLEQERNYNQAKLSELSILMDSTSSHTPAECLLKEKSMQCAELSTDVDFLRHKLRLAEAIIESLRKEIEQKNFLIRRLTSFGEGDLSLDDFILSLQDEHERSLAKAADLSVQLAESQGRVDELKAQVRKLTDQGAMGSVTRQSIIAAETMIRNNIARVRTYSRDQNSSDDLGYVGAPSSPRRSNRNLSFHSRFMNGDFDKSDHTFDSFDM